MPSAQRMPMSGILAERGGSRRDLVNVVVL